MSVPDQDNVLFLGCYALSLAVIGAIFIVAYGFHMGLLLAPAYLVLYGSYLLVDWWRHRGGYPRNR